MLKLILLLFAIFIFTYSISHGASAKKQDDNFSDRLSQSFDTTPLGKRNDGIATDPNEETVHLPQDAAVESPQMLEQKESARMRDEYRKSGY